MLQFQHPAFVNAPVLRQEYESGKGVRMIAGTPTYRADRKRKILRVIANYWLDHGYAPSVRDIARGTGDPTTSTVARWLMIMEGDGLIMSAPDRPRTIRLTAKGETMVRG